MFVVWSLSHVRLRDPMECSPPGSSMRFPRQEYLRGLPFPSPGDLPNPGTEPESLVSFIGQAYSSSPSHLAGPLETLTTLHLRLVLVGDALEAVSSS